LDLEIERPGNSRGDSQATREAASQPAQSATITQESAGVPPADQKAKRLARALVSDILVYNREKRDKALADGTLVQALGQEIKKSWELYKERVTPEVAASSNHFKDALNEILADGQKIF
jgi:molybdopterin converting factor small subunit